MDLSPGQRRLVFVVVVIVLVGLCVYLVRSHNSSGSSAAPSATASTTPTGAATSAAPGLPPSSVPAATPASTVGGAEIYQWLPFTPTDLAEAATTVTTFATDYVTWSYTESATAYAGKLRSLVTSQELPQVEQGYETPGVSGPRAADKQVSTGSGTIESISSFGTGPKSIVFTVTINQQVTSTQPTQTQANQYSVTVTTTGGAWLVSGVQLTQLGNQGIQ